MKQTILFLFVFITTIQTTFSQNYKSEFNQLLSKNDTTKQRILLQKWETENNQDPELYVAYFNYFVNRSKQEIIEIGNNPQGDDVLKITSTDKSKKDPVGYIYGVQMFNPSLVQKGFFYADKGLQIAPARLDIRFGKVFVYSKMKDWNNYAQEIIKAVTYGATIENKWLWNENKPLDDPKEFLLSNIQTYQTQLYDTNDDNLLIYMRQIAQAVLKYYPDNVENLSNLSITYMLNKEYDKALEPLLTAAKIAPTDYIVLSNIAYAYKMKGDKKNAIEYYKLVLKHGDVDSSKYAQQQIDELGR